MIRNPINKFLFQRKSKLKTFAKNLNCPIVNPKAKKTSLFDVTLLNYKPNFLSQSLFLALFWKTNFQVDEKLALKSANAFVAQFLPEIEMKKKLDFDLNHSFCSDVSKIVRTISWLHRFMVWWYLMFDYVTEYPFLG